MTSILERTSRRAAFHSEDEFRLEERKPLRVKGDPNSHHVWRDVTTALQCTERLVRIAREKGAAIHVLHISTEEEIEFLANHKDVARPLRRRPHQPHARLEPLCDARPRSCR